MIDSSNAIPKGNIRNLLIDFGVVLIDLDKERCLRAFEDIGVQGLGALLQSAHQLGFLNDFEQGLITSSEFCVNVRSHLDCIHANIPDEKILAAWNCFLVGIPAYKLDLLLHLRKQYRLLLLSNTNEAHWNWSCAHDFSYKGHQVQDFFHDIYLSFKLHVEKPKPGIFEKVIADSGIIPEETLFIDDSDLNCEVGRSFGFHTYAPKPREDWNRVLQLAVEKPFVL